VLSSGTYHRLYFTGEPKIRGRTLTADSEQGRHATIAHVPGAPSGSDFAVEVPEDATTKLQDHHRGTVRVMIPPTITPPLFKRARHDLHHGRRRPAKALPGARGVKAIKVQ
jgi:hypothetical protein